MTTRRSPADGPEREARDQWAAAYPLTAMRTLAAAGYDATARAAWLREVVGLGPEDVPDFAGDHYLHAMGAPPAPALVGAARFAHTGLVRGAADGCLRSVFGDAYGQLLAGQDSLAIDDLIDLANDEGRPDLYQAAQVLQRRLTGSSLAAYVLTLCHHRPYARGYCGEMACPNYAAKHGWPWGDGDDG